MIEVTKDPIHPVGKNGEHLIKSNQHMDILYAFINYVRATFNHGNSPSEVDWCDPKGELTEMLKHTSNGYMLMEVDWGGNLKLIHTSCGYMLMEVDWGGNLKHNYTSSGSMLMEVDWGGKLVINSRELMKLPQMDTTSLKLTGEAMVPVPTI